MGLCKMSGFERILIYCVSDFEGFHCIIIFIFVCMYTTVILYLLMPFQTKYLKSEL